MARIEESIEIRCPVDKVFAYTTVENNWPKWHGTMLEAEQTSQGQVGRHHIQSKKSYDGADIGDDR